MLSIIIAMIVILVLAGLVLTYVAYPHRGQDVPKATWLSTAMARLVQRAPVMKLEKATDRSELLRR